ncbi:MAG: hypothetical protein AB1458_01890 [Bacteroidota bacterium]
MEQAATVQLMDERIASFMSGQTSLTLAVSSNNEPYCATCFYSYIKDGHLLVIKSKPTTAHARIAEKNPLVAGTILPDKMDKTRIRGIQFTGKIIIPDRSAMNRARDGYYIKFPFALTFTGELIVIQLLRVKYTDSLLGLGERLTWPK